MRCGQRLQPAFSDEHSLEFSTDFYGGFPMHYTQPDVPFSQTCAPFLRANIDTNHRAGPRAGRTMRRFASVLLDMLLTAVFAFAQVESGQIAGTVTDESCAVVPNATVTVQNLASDVHSGT